MPWYKIEAWCGPGHQSHSVYYHFSRRRLKGPQKKELWEAKFEGRDAALGKVIRVNTLPAQVHQSKVFDYALTVSHAQGMLEILENTPAETKYRGYSIFFARGDQRHADSWSTRLAHEGFVVRQKGEIIFPQRVWFHGEVGAKEAIDILIKVRGDIGEWWTEWDRRRKNLREARRRIVNAERQTH